MPRFDVVPSVPIETESKRDGARFYCLTAPIGFAVYDNDSKRRLDTPYQSRGKAHDECQRLNHEYVQASMLAPEPLILAEA